MERRVWHELTSTEELVWSTNRDAQTGILWLAELRNTRRCCQGAARACTRNRHAREETRLQCGERSLESKHHHNFFDVSKKQWPLQCFLHREIFDLWTKNWRELLTYFQLPVFVPHLCTTPSSFYTSTFLWSLLWHINAFPLYSPSSLVPSTSPIQTFDISSVAIATQPLQAVLLPPALTYLPIGHAASFLFVLAQGATCPERPTAWSLPAVSTWHNLACGVRLHLRRPSAGTYIDVRRVHTTHTHASVTICPRQLWATR